jgi:hypothetical protein
MSSARTGIVLIAAFFFACGGTNSGDTTQKTTAISHALSVVVSGGGSVSSKPAGIDCGATCSASFDAGTAVTLTASAKTGNTFTGWSGACSGTGACPVTMSDSESVTATFAVQRVQLSWTSTDDGSGRSSLSASPQGTSCGNNCFTYDFGAQVTLTANAATGFAAAPSGGGCTGAGPCTLTLTADTAVTAVFSLIKVRLFTPANGGNGSGDVALTPAGTSCGTDCHELDYGTHVAIDGQPATGSVFTTFSGAGCGETTPCQVVVTDPATTVTATFTLLKISFFLEPINGTVTLDPPGTLACTGSCAVFLFDYGTQVTVTAAPNPNFVLSRFALCGGALSCTVTATVNNTVVQPVFQQRLVAVHVDLLGRGVGTVRGLACTSTACDGTIAAGSSLTLVPSTLTGFSKWSGGGCSGLGPCTFGSVTADIATAAVFDNRGIFLEADDVIGTLWRFDPSNFLTQLGGSLLGQTGDLAWDPVQRVLYFTNGLTGNDAGLLTLDPFTGEQLTLGATGVDNLRRCTRRTWPTCGACWASGIATPSAPSGRPRYARWCRRNGRRLSRWQNGRSRCTAS